MNKNHSAAQQFIKLLCEGNLLAHPTDTIPGVTCDPNNLHSIQNLAHIKGREAAKTFVSLTSSFAKACGFYQALPKIWTNILNQIWPGPLTVVYKASAQCPQGLVAENGTIAIRVPKLDPEFFWFQEVLEEITFPLPSTSINRSGQLSGQWHEVKKLQSEFPLIDFQFLAGIEKSEPQSPSTILQIHNEQENEQENGQKDVQYKILREGAIKKHMIDKLFKSASSR